MTDGQWALLAPLLPAAGSTGGRGGRPEKWHRRGRGPVPTAAVIDSWTVHPATNVPTTGGGYDGGLVQKCCVTYPPTPQSWNNAVPV
ncbi:hypothetical protein ACIRQP_35515 [Streptomyces sp. NPDC102274]|uniref:hypothetical protein n=1 Tax=Streptomyces sp. NPDC102274 TaxID=3366151 RepID=UPI0037FEB5B0